MAAFRTITNSVATVLRNISLTYVHYVSIDYFSVSLVGILRWLTNVTAKANRSRQKKIAHGKRKSLTAKENSITAKANQLYAIFLPSGVHHFSLVCLYFIGNFTVCRRISGFGTPLLRKVHIDRNHKKASKHDIYPQFRNEITEKWCARSLLHLEIYDISRQ